uniref:Uncharacterized protein n=1 Tax=Desulfovibrio sp. U5L TaxID=596152 RepID=I2Q2N8_9BACT
MRRYLQHWFNDCHLYCRFRDLRFSSGRAKRWSRAIAQWLRPCLYGKRS